MSFLVVPMFEEIYSDWGSTPPSITRWAIAIAHFMQTIWKPLVLMGLLVAIPSLIAWSYFSKRVETLAVEMETLCDEFLQRQYRTKNQAT